MRQRRLVGSVLILATFIYLLAALLAFYQNQRVSMEKGMEEAFKAFSEKEKLEIKELSKDISGLLDEKMDAKLGSQQVLKFEGSFARMEKNFNSMSEGVTDIERDISQLQERIYELEKEYLIHCEETKEAREEIEKWKDKLSDMEEVKLRLLKAEQAIGENEEAYKEMDKLFREQWKENEKNLEHLKNNVLYYQYDSESNTLNLYGNQE